MTRSSFPVLVSRALARHALADTPDADLLARFRTGRDPQAFAELVERYAPLVWGACRRVLNDATRAEDAFQATFVTFARKAAGIRRPDRLAGWLYGVARRTAWHHRDAHPSINAVPDRASNEPSPLEQVTGKELVGAVEAEVERLPEKYRSAVLLCWFEDCSLDEAAKRLGVSRGVLWGRLRYAREQLQRRLGRRGFGVPAVLGAGLVGAGPASARLVERAVTAGLKAPADVGVGILGLSPAVKPAGLAALAAAVVVGLVTVMPAGGPDTPPKGPPKQDTQPEVAVRKTDDGIPLPAGALHRFGNRQARHPDGIFASAVSPDGKYLATVGNSTVIVWDVRTMVAKCVLRGQSIQQFQGSGGARVSFFPDSKRLLVVVHPGNTYFVQVQDNARKADVARVFDVETGKLELTVKGEPDYGAAAWLSAGGKEIAVFSHQAVAYYDAKDGKELRKVACGPALHGVPVVAPQANRMVMRQNDNNTFVIVDLKTGERVDELTFDNIHHLMLTPDGKRLAVVDGAGKVHVRDVEAKKELAAFATPAGAGVTGMQFSADQQTLYFIGQHGRVYRWDLKTLKKLPDVGQHSSWTGSGIALSPDETVLYSMGYDKLIRRWDLKTVKEIPLPDGYVTQTAVVPLPDRKTMLVADHAGRLDRWDLATGKLLRQLQPPKSGGIDCVAVSADGRWFAGGRTVQDVTLWDLKAGKQERLIPLVDKPDPNGSDHVKRVAFNAAGTVLFTTSGKTGVTAWEVPTGRKLWNAPGSGPWLAVDPSGRWVAAGGGSNPDKIQWTLLNQATGAVVRRADVLPVERAEGTQSFQYPPYLSDLTFTPDGSRLVTAHYDGTVRVWEPEAGRQLHSEFEGRWGTACVAVSPDGRWVGVGHSDKRITVLELASGKRLLELTGHDSAVRDVAFTRDGRGIIGNADLAPILWTLEARDNSKPDDAAWQVLASDDGAKAYRVQWALVRDPAGAVKLLNEKIKPAELALERAQFDKWVANLDSPRFPVREAAERDLTRAGIKVPVGWLRTAVEASKSDEARARLGRILAEREKPNPQEWRLQRAVQVLELSGTPEAVALLKSWAAVDGSPVTEASRGAVGRLTAR